MTTDPLLLSEMAKLGEEQLKRMPFTIACYQGGGAPSYYRDDELDSNFLPKFLARHIYLDQIGSSGAIGVLKAGVELTGKQILEEFGLDGEVLDNIIEIRMRINLLDGDVRRLMRQVLK